MIWGKLIKSVAVFKGYVPGHIPGENHNTKRYMHLPMFIAALFTITKRWKQPKRPSTYECIKKM